ncbi:MAG: NERD domain-containing protein [Erysipelotrichales bacterium]|nr:NERD domain-containing protein [Erysipelotrichales bacterium]
MTPELTTFLIVILALLSIYLLISYPLKKLLSRKLFRYFYYRRIYRYVEKKDLRLINNFEFTVDESTIAHFDHVVFGNKYIYLIIDKYWTKGIYGKEEDKSWLLFKSEEKRIYIDNPLKKNELRTEKLSLVSGIDRNMFVSIVIVNNDCLVDETIKLNKQNIILKERHLLKTIETFEKEDIENINDEQLQKVVYAFDKIKKSTSN